MSENSGEASAAQSSPVALNLPTSELARIDGLCAAAERPEAYWMAEALRKKTADETLPDGVRDGWRLLASILGMHFRPKNAREPFGPIFSLSDGRRSITRDDLTPEHLALLSAVIALSRDCEIQARIADVIWLKTKDPAFARKGVRAYLASAERLEDPNHWPPCAERLERAARLARMLGREDSALIDVLGTILKKIRVYRGRDNLFLTNELAELLHEFRHGDPAELAQYTLAGAERARAQPDFNRARAYYETTAKLYVRVKDKRAFARMRLAIAETFREEAEATSAQEIISLRTSAGPTRLWPIARRPEVLRRFPNCKPACT